MNNGNTATLTATANSGRVPLIFYLSSIIFLLTACTTIPDRPPTPTPQHSGTLDDIARTLPGEYSNYLQWREHEDPATGPVTLEILHEPMVDPQWARFLLRQTSPEQRPRRFALELTPGEPPDRFEGVFIPLDMAAAGQCQMHFRLLSAGLSGETRPDDCRFGDGEQAVGLLKEIAFDGQQIVIADQLFDLDQGEAVGETQVLRFFRQRRFHGWAGVRDGDGWRLAQDLILHSEGDEIIPTDAYGRDLGVRLQLARILWREDQPPILRLSVYDTDSGRLLGYAWADPDAMQLGINLPEVQAGLTATSVD